MHLKTMFRRSELSESMVMYRQTILQPLPSLIAFANEIASGLKTPALQTDFYCISKSFIVSHGELKIWSFLPYTFFYLHYIINKM